MYIWKWKIQHSIILLAVLIMWSIHTHSSVRNEMNCFIGYIIDHFRVSYIYLRAPLQCLLKWFVPVSDQSLGIVSLSWILEAPVDSYLSVISLWNTYPQIQDQCCTLAYNGKDNDRLESLMPDILVYLPDRIPCECEMKRRRN